MYYFHNSLIIKMVNKITGSDQIPHKFLIYVKTKYNSPVKNSIPLIIK